MFPNANNKVLWGEVVAKDEGLNRKICSPTNFRKKNVENSKVFVALESENLTHCLITFLCPHFVKLKRKT